MCVMPWLRGYDPVGVVAPEDLTSSGNNLLHLQVHRPIHLAPEGEDRLAYEEPQGEVQYSTVLQNLQNNST